MEKHVSIHSFQAHEARTKQQNAPSADFDDGISIRTETDVDDRMADLVAKNATLERVRLSFIQPITRDSSVNVDYSV